MKEKQWGVYILRCGDGTYYTGSTDCLSRRFQAHNSGKGAKYTRGRGPLQVVFWESCQNHSEALKREYQIKKLSRKEKEDLILTAPYV